MLVIKGSSNWTIFAQYDTNKIEKTYSLNYAFIVGAKPLFIGTFYGVQIVLFQLPNFISLPFELRSTDLLSQRTRKKRPQIIVALKVNYARNIYRGDGTDLLPVVEE